MSSFTYCVCGWQDVNVPSENVPSLQSVHSVSLRAVPAQIQIYTLKLLHFTYYEVISVIWHHHCHHICLISFQWSWSWHLKITHPIIVLCLIMIVDKFLYFTILSFLSNDGIRFITKLLFERKLQWSKCHQLHCFMQILSILKIFMLICSCQ